MNVKVKETLNRIKEKVHQGNTDDTIDSLEALKNSLNHQRNEQKCLVIDDLSGTHRYKMLDKAIIPKNGIPVIDKGEQVYYLQFDGTTLEPLDYFPIDNNKKTPQDCYRSQWWEGLKKMLSFGNQTIEKIKLAIFVCLAAALVFILFIIGIVAMGGDTVAQ
jgi:hypothetical protein